MVGRGGHFVMIAVTAPATRTSTSTYATRSTAARTSPWRRSPAAIRAPGPGRTATTRNRSAVPIVTPELPPRALDAVGQALAATGRIADAAELVGWRALLEEEQRVVAAVGRAGREPGAGGAVVNRGGFVESTMTTCAGPSGTNAPAPSD